MWAILIPLGVILLKVLFAALAVLLGMTPFLDRFRRRVLRRLVCDVADVLHSQGVNYWTDFGTLLGLVREGDIILGDKDADFCVLATERPVIMAAAKRFEERGYLLTGEGGAKKKLIRVFDRRTPFYADICTYVDDGAILRSLLDAREDVPVHLVADAHPQPFRDGAVRVPKNPRALLEYRYGPEYVTPRRNDKGRGGGRAIWLSVLQELEASALFLWFYVRRALGGSASRR